MTPATSVVIPCYNGERYLGETLESIRKQTTPVREIFVIDDGSNVPLQAPPGWTGPPLHIIRTPNRGQSAARNFGASRATGEFIAFVDADDLWQPRKIEAQEAALRADPGAAGCFTRCLDAPGFFGFGPYPEPDVSDDEFLLVLWYNNFFPPSAVMVRRETFVKAGGFREDIRGPEDIELWLRLLRQGRLVQVPEPLVCYRVHPTQWTSNNQRRFADGKKVRKVMIAEHADRLVAAGLPRNRLWDAYRKDVLLLYYRRQFSAARGLLWDFWKDHPSDWRVFVYFLISLLPAGLLRRLRGEVPLTRPEGDKQAATGNAAWKALFQRIQLSTSAR
jgi:glycosyltransferase involved in cell wall biosynthesis